MKRILIILLNTTALTLIIYLLISHGMPDRFFELFILSVWVITPMANICYILLPNRKTFSFNASKTLRLAMLIIGILLITVSLCQAFGIVDSYSEITSIFQGSIRKKIREGTPLTKKEKKIIMMPANIGLGLVKIQSFAFIECFIGCLLICFSQHLYYEEKIKFNKSIQRTEYRR